MSSLLIIAARRAERRIIDRLTQAQATGPDRPQPLERLGGLEARQLRRLNRSGAVREASPGQFYLDEPTYAAYRLRRQALALGLMLVALAVAGWLYFQYGYRG